MPNRLIRQGLLPVLCLMVSHAVLADGKVGSVDTRPLREKWEEEARTQREAKEARERQQALAAARKEEEVRERRRIEAERERQEAWTASKRKEAEEAKQRREAEAERKRQEAIAAQRKREQKEELERWRQAETRREQRQARAERKRKAEAELRERRRAEAHREHRRYVAAHRARHSNASELFARRETYRRFVLKPPALPQKPPEESAEVIERPTAYHYSIPCLLGEEYGTPIICYRNNPDLLELSEEDCAAVDGFFDQAGVCFSRQSCQQNHGRRDSEGDCFIPSPMGSRAEPAGNRFEEL